jgi:hypothetical protein
VKDFTTTWELFQLPEEAYQQILEQRKTEVPRFIINALKGYENS